MPKMEPTLMPAWVDRARVRVRVCVCEGVCTKEGDHRRSALRPRVHAQRWQGRNNTITHSAC